MTVLNGITFLFCLLSSVAHAECVPTPDCASIGYTAESCEGDALKCPFDTTKLFCAPCDSVYQYSCTNAGEIGKGNSCNGKYIECGCANGYEVDGTGCKLSCATTYQYTCSGTGYSGGSGTACGGKYTSCTCASGYRWINGTCTCDTSCTVGNIMYSDGTCSSCVVNGKTPIGVVVKDNALVLNQIKEVTFGSKADTSLPNYTSYTDAKNDFNGKANTATIMAESLDNRAVEACNEFTTNGTNAGDWYLPAWRELYRYVYGNKNAIDPYLYNQLSGQLWSSSEYSQDYACLLNTSDGRLAYTGKNSHMYFKCFLEIN